MESAIRTQEVNPAKLAQLFRKQFELCRVGAGQSARDACGREQASLPNAIKQ